MQQDDFCPYTYAALEYPEPWLRMPVWTLNESALLLAGLNPCAVEDLERRRPDDAEYLLWDRVGYRSILRTLESAQHAEMIKFPAPWKTVMEIAGKLGIGVLGELREYVEYENMPHPSDCEKDWPWGDYQTPLLKILAAAVTEFFEPRRTRDAKKEEVVEWIKKRMETAGLSPSDNLAEAIFTIIKPADHNPRQRRE